MHNIVMHVINVDIYCSYTCYDVIIYEPSGNGCNRLREIFPNENNNRDAHAGTS